MRVNSASLRLNSFLSHTSSGYFSCAIRRAGAVPQKSAAEYAAAQISSPAPMISPNRFINARASGTDQPIEYIAGPGLTPVLSPARVPANIPPPTPPPAPPSDKKAPAVGAQTCPQKAVAVSPRRQSRQRVPHARFAATPAPENAPATARPRATPANTCRAHPGSFLVQYSYMS